MLEFRTLGTIALRGEDGRGLQSVLGHPKRLALLAYLSASQPPRLHPREALVALLWPELDEHHARGALRQELYQLRRSLGSGVVVTGGDVAVGVNAERLWCDARAFESALKTGILVPALELYRGDFLPGLHVDSSEFERWMDGERARLAGRAREIARRLSEDAERAGAVAEAVSWCRRLTELGPCDETSWQRLMLLLDRMGDRAGALVAYDSMTALLRRELEIEPSPETRGLADRIRGRIEVSGSADTGQADAEPAHGGAETVGRSEVAETPSERAARRFPRSLLVALSLSTIAVALILATAVPRRSLAPSRLVIGLVPVENQTGEANLDALTFWATDVLAQGLAGAGFVDVAVGGGTDRAAVVISAALYRRGEQLEIMPRLVEPGLGGRLVEMPRGVLLSLESPDVAVDSLVRQVLASLATHYDPRFDAASAPDRSIPIETPSWEAYQEYVRGSQLFGGLEFGKAAHHLLKAYEIDPGFVKSAIFGAVALAEDGSPAAAESVTTAAMAEAGSLLPYERFFGAWLVADLRGRRPEAYRAAMELARIGPTTPTMFLAGREALRMNRPSEAVRYLRDLDLEKGWWRGWTEYWEVLAGAYHMLGEHTAELTTARAGRNRFPESLTLILTEVRARAALGEHDRVLVLIDEAMTLPAGRTTPAEVGWIAAQELSAHGEEEAAAAARRLALAWLGQHPGGQDGRDLLRGWLLLDSDAEEASRALGALHTVQDLEWVGLAGRLAAARGDTAAAQSAIARLEEWRDPHVRGRHLLLAAGIRAGLGQPDEAMETLRRAFATGAPFGVHVHAWSLLRPLSERGEFIAFLRPRG